ncbi:F510_1955 family glycosylhydrolase [Actinomycetospora callitridis]|uniref:F510_1955 family glycosylhydrolase n=1 Tax=Actinomycetospora callitridis TaxID=913944 RepID=UPI0023667814|nr:hypothetical protein [Actinomycetospora callitridis]MDD7921266.1 hypothetical protein [Actinomycetospora callitridis]
MVVILPTVLGAACTRDDTASGRPEPSPSVLGHVHGLGIDPLNGGLYVATHGGLFRAGPTGLEKVGTSAAANRDLMGFLVVGPGVFLASGHPSPLEATPNPLGLVRSTDGGLSWQTIALSGEVDFHALAQGPGGIYGVDAEGSVRFSQDGGVRWEAWPAPPALDVAADPHRPGHLVLAVVGGIAAVDGSAASAPGTPAPVVELAPQMAYLSWAPDGELFGLTTDARLLASPDGGASWLPRATVPGGRPQSLTAVGQERVLAATAGGVHESRDGGRTFTTLATMGT